MKKIVIFILVICTLLFSGCSCSKKQTLAFDTNWLNMETNFNKRYKVSLGDYSDGNNSFIYKNKDKYGEILLTGDYDISLKWCPPSEVTDLISENFMKTFTGDSLYKLETTLDLAITYKSVSDEEHNDTIKTTSYFFGKNLYPVYSKIESNTTYLGLKDGKTEITKNSSIDEIRYDIDTYSISRKKYSADNKEEINQNDKYDYTQGTVIDNSILLFALENYAVEKASTKNLAVISPVYGKDCTLNVQCYDVLSSMPNTDYKDVKIESFILKPDSTGCFGGNTGKSQIIYLNKTAKSNEIVKYVSPLTSYDSSYVCLGALIFELEKD